MFMSGNPSVAAAAAASASNNIPGVLYCCCRLMEIVKNRQSELLPVMHQARN